MLKNNATGGYRLDELKKVAGEFKAWRYTASFEDGSEDMVPVPVGVCKGEQLGMLATTPRSKKLVKGYSQYMCLDFSALPQSEQTIGFHLDTKGDATGQYSGIRLNWLLSCNPDDQDCYSEKTSLL